MFRKAESDMLLYVFSRVGHYMERIWVHQRWANIHTLILWGPDQLDAILQTTFSNAFFLMKMYWFPFPFHWGWFPRIQLTMLIQIMDWRLVGAKPLTEPKMVRLSTHLYVTRPQWVNAKQADLFPTGYNHCGVRVCTEETFFIASTVIYVFKLIWIMSC